MKVITTACRTRSVGQEVRLRATEHLLQVFHREQQVAVHPLSDEQGRFSTNPDHMPSHHKFVLNTDSDWLLREAAKVGPHTAAYMTAVLRSRPFPQQAFRTCLGILNLAQKYLPSQMEVACQRLLNPKLLTYQDLKSELEHLPIDSDSAGPARSRSCARRSILSIGEKNDDLANPP